MRLHHLTVTAIGPFAGTERVDFDELAEAGVFLVTGATGAGKSSLLDAVCFALYGVVPGARGVKGLRSDHAAPEVAPEVVLDFAVRDRRFVVRRSPEWIRPRRSGSGSTTVRASASLLETTGGVERLVSSRAQEVGHTVGDLLQLSATQFQQVVLLPQGGFATFLRASSQERHDVLQQLFHTRRFADIEAWVHDRARASGAEASAAADEVRRHAHTLADRCGAPLPHALDDDTLAASGAGALTDWAARAAAAAQAEAAAADQRRRAAERRLHEAAARHLSAERGRELRRRRDEARAVAAELDADGAEADRVAAAVTNADRAARVVPLLGLLDDAERTVAACEQARDRALAGLSGAAGGDNRDGPPDSAELATLHAARRDVLARLIALLPREAELHGAVRDRDQAATLLRAARAAASQLEERSAALPGRLSTLRSRLQSLTADSARAGLLASEAAALRRAHEAAVAYPGAHADALAARAAALDARGRAASAQERLLGLVERRLAGMAAELAAGLAAGDPCPVCGSAAHPLPAAPAADQVDPADLDVARSRLEARQAEATTAERVAADAAAHARRVGDATAGRDVETARRELAELTAAAEHARAAAAEREVVAEELDRVAQSEHRLRSRLQEALSDRAAAEARHAAAAREAGRLTAELAEAAAAVRWAAAAGAAAEPVRVADLVDVVRTEVRLVEQAAQAARTAEQAAGERDRVRARAEAAAQDQGFATVDQVRSAVVAPAERERLEGLLRDRDRRRERAAAVLADPEVAALDQVRIEDPAQTEAAGAVAEAECEAATRAAHVAEETRGAAVRTAASLRDAVRVWQPRRNDAATAQSVARLVRGTGADNQLQMRLSAYVLATRLDQVVDAANERLGHMREHRYLLERTARATRRGSPAGLGLQVLDLWTGDTRDPATLSGGETFVVSLALALGLADVVTHEAGGVQLQTLFVDEGFGMLDADTLDDVMDRLDGLRTGGRTVGVVSHVSELRGRIPVQLHVHKSRAGSRVEVRTLVA